MYVFSFLLDCEWYYGQIKDQVWDILIETGRQKESQQSEENIITAGSLHKLNEF